MKPTASKPLSEKFLYLGPQARRMLVTHCEKKLTQADWFRLREAVKNENHHELCIALDNFLEYVFNALPFATTKEIENAPNLKR